MKTYKTWEVIKMLTENPELKFKRSGSDSDDMLLSADDYDRHYLSWESGRRHLAIEDEWKLVPQPVSFMEAAKALYDGKTIYCKYGNEIHTYKPNENYTLKDDKNSEIVVAEILEWKWYIEEE